MVLQGSGASRGNKAVKENKLTFRLIIRDKQEFRGAGKADLRLLVRAV